MPKGSTPGPVPQTNLTKNRKSNMLEINVQKPLRLNMAAAALPCRLQQLNLEIKSREQWDRCWFSVYKATGGCQVGTSHP